MSGMLPKGAIISISSSFGTSKAMSAISNAVNAVATLEASHGVVANDVVLVQSGWALLDSRVAQASAVSTNDVTLGGIDTSDASRYPAGSGIGSVKEVLTWVQISEITDPSSSGGEPQFSSYTLLDDGQERQLQKGKSAKSMKLSMLDNPKAAYYPVLMAADDDQQYRVLRLRLPNGATLYYPVTVSFDTTPSLDTSKPMTVSATFSIMAKETRYNPA